MKQFLSNILNFVLLTAVLISSSSFSVVTEGDSLKNPEVSQSIPSDELLDIRITTPSVQMIKKADLEIHKSMAEYIQKLKSFKVTGFGAERADLELNVQFELENKLKLINNSYLSDYDMNNWFYLNLYFNQLSSNFQQTDTLLHSRFEFDN